MSEDKSCEIAKMALDCLKTKLEGDKVAAESEGNMWSAVEEIVKAIATVLPKMMEEAGGKRGLVKVEKVFPALTREDLMFFAKKAPLQDLEAIVRDLTAALESRKKAEPK